jgi:hypothetical protein
MNTASSSKTSVINGLTTQCNIAEDSHIHTCHHENLIHQNAIICLINDSVSSSNYTELNDRTINEFERIQKKAAVA